ncbi:Lipid-A-disaccharide synthase related glycosyltransferase [Halanaeroarchaeum sp. HSR-CO]|uniref:DUF354 domain-containing protein n=1 Tax=Halanaeroarchaeum sp. HSR-CO TaxID=2866382 RepID=UPI00217EFFD5|nr:DUF354 domain-containing protein [Halanaeroarchaeum sp. HSR-CO]UWG48164.1 Lipid-A-disaccharide synthase related glycosyltransferase [Halanaeroarchaeum sp. HSR-CO]
MRIWFVILHPARVHLYRHAIRALDDRGWDVRVFTRNSDSIRDLLDAYEIEYTVLADTGDSKLGVIRSQAKFELAFARAALTGRPDLVVDGLGSMLVGRMLGATTVAFWDTEHNRFQKLVVGPFVDRIFTPESYQNDISDKQIRYAGFHDLAYLHPNRFQPDPSILDDIGLEPGDRFVVVRTVAWNATHDIGDSGFEDLIDVVDSLEAMGVDVFLSAEADLPDSLAARELAIESDRIHDLLYYADLFIGESGTMATESAILGTPAIFVSTLEAGVLQELETTYGLVTNISGANRSERAIEAARHILERDPAIWERRRARLLSDTIDVTAFMLDQFEDIATEE